MATTITNPTKLAPADTRHINWTTFGALPIHNDSGSTYHYCLENSISYASHEGDTPRFSKDAPRLYVYWDSTTSEWIDGFGYDSIITSITTT